MNRIGRPEYSILETIIYSHFQYFYMSFLQEVGRRETTAGIRERSIYVGLEHVRYIVGGQ